MKTMWQWVVSAFVIGIFVSMGFIFMGGHFGTNGVVLAQTSATPVPVTAQFDQKAALAKLREQIKGREREPANKVFKNIQMEGWTTASHVVAAMEMGYARSLGVDCTHCHVPEKWESDEKNTKLIAREMVAMQKTINTQLLKNIKGLKGESPTVNCTTCHRGQVVPALSLPMPGR